MVQRKNITIRDEQDAYVQRANLNLSRFVQDRLAEEMGPTEEELADAYKRNRERDQEVYEAWEGISREANDLLGDAPEVEFDPEHERSTDRETR